MESNKISRRDLLRGTALTGAGLLAASSGLPVFAEDKPNAPLPIGASGKLAKMSTAPSISKRRRTSSGRRSPVFAKAGRRTRHLDHQSGGVRRLPGQDERGREGQDPPDFAYTSNVSIAQMHLLDLQRWNVTDVVEEAIKRYGDVMPGLNAARSAKFDGKWAAVPYLGTFTPQFVRGDKLAEKNIDPASLKTLE